MCLSFKPKTVNQGYNTGTKDLTKCLCSQSSFYLHSSLQQLTSKWEEVGGRSQGQY